MNKAFPSEFVYQLFALLIAFILVHAVYVSVIRPGARAFLKQEYAAMQVDPDYVGQRSGYVVLKDYEQESTFVLMFWALAIIGYKGARVYQEQRVLETGVGGLGELGVIHLDSAEGLLDEIEATDQARLDFLLPRAMIAALERFTATGQVQDAASTAREVCATEAERLESELSIIRYIAWAIPSVGFIGTVRGIGDALAQAHKAVEGDITGVTASLGVAFNSTFVALVISIVLMFFIHQLQRMQESMVLDTGNFCDHTLIRRLRGG